MSRRYRIHALPFLLLVAGLVVTGCDQSSQNMDPKDANRYIITQANSAQGDAVTGSFAGAQKVFVPDTVDYYVQGFTVNKSYNWTVNGNDVPSAERSTDSYVWERRKGEFVSLMFTMDDPVTDVDPSGETVDSFAVNSPDDDINPETLGITVIVPDIARQLDRLPASATGGRFSTMQTIVNSSGVGAWLQQGDPGGDPSYTVFAPSDEAFAALGGTPTQATDSDEPATSSVRADLLKHHVLPNRVQSSDLPDGTASTLFGNQTIDVDPADGKVNGRATLLGTDFPTVGKGFVHTIDTVLRPSTASADFTDEEASAPLTETVQVDGVYIPDGGGFVVVHDSTGLASAETGSSVVGHSAYLDPGIHNDVSVALDKPVDDDVTLGAVPHRDANGNQRFDGGAAGGDAPYTLSGETVVDYAEYTIGN